MQWGPLTEKQAHTWLSKLSDSNNKHERRETLVVNDIDRFYPPLADWMHDTFNFLPNWRMDDGQISLAENGGGIGPHVDNYDVFLIQMSGTRTWEVGKRKVTAHEERDRTIDGLDVRVLSDWGSDITDDNTEANNNREMEEWIVNPGDLLYLPPRVAHCGTALETGSMTLSVGCRAPSVSELVSKLAESLSSSIEDSAVCRYTDENLLEEIDEINSQGELTTKAKERARDLVIESLSSIISDDDWWDEFFGRYVTEQKRVRNNYPIPLDDWDDEYSDIEWRDAKSMVQSVLDGKCVLYHAEGIAFAYSTATSTVHPGRIIHRFFVNGEMWQNESVDTATDKNVMQHLYQTVANHRMLSKTILLGQQKENGANNSSTQQSELTPGAVEFLEDLVSAGVLYASEE